MSKNNLQGLSELPGSKILETVPTVAKCTWSDGSQFVISEEWKGAEDEALMRTISPDRNALHLPSNQDAPDRLQTLALPSYGRGDIIIPQEPPVIDGVTYPVITRKGIGSPQQPVAETGEVFGTPVKLNPDRYTAGFTSESTFKGDKYFTEIWNKARIRVRQPLRFFKLDRIFMTTGAESITPTDTEEGISKKFPKAENSGIPVWASRNPITFLDAIKFLTPESSPPDLSKLKSIADNLLQVQALFLKDDDYQNAKELSELVAKGEGSGESEWFQWLSKGYGQQMMRKTSAGLVHCEYHRQNSSLGIEIKDLADTDGVSIDMLASDKDLKSWENAKNESPDMANEIIKENLFQLVHIIDLRTAFNVVNGRPWDYELAETVNNFMTAMQEEDSAIYPEVAYRMYRSIMRSPGYFESKGDMYGLSLLSFADIHNDKDPLLPNTPVLSEAMLTEVAELIRQKLDIDGLDEYIADRLPAERYELKYGLGSAEDLLKSLERYNFLSSDPEFVPEFQKLASQLSEITQNSALDIYHEFRDMTLHLLLPHIEKFYKYDRDRLDFMSLFLGESGMAKFIADLVASPPEKRQNYIDEHFPKSLNPIDLAPVAEYVKKYY